MKRNEIETSLTWDLSSLFADQQAFDQQVEQANHLLEQLKSCKGTIANTKESFMNFIEDMETFDRIIENLSVYSNMCVDVDPKNDLVQDNLAKANSLEQQAVVTLSFMDTEFIQHKEAIDLYLQEEECKDFRYFFTEIFRTIPHRLDEKTEALMAEAEALTKAPEDTFRSFNMEFKPVNVDGKEEFLNGATYPFFLENKDAEVRKTAFENYFGEYGHYQNIFMNTLTAHAKGQVFKAKARNFNSALEASLFEDGADKTLFDKVLYMANDKYHAYVEEYFQLRKEILHLDTQHVYDIQLDLVEGMDMKYSIDESFDLMYKALACLGDDYVALLHKAKEDRWIDFLPHEHKRSGAYSWGSYDSNPCILTNFNGNYDSLSTLAHELGHSMHSYYSHANNRFINAHYRIFVAEVASIVNEILLIKYLLSTTTDKKQKAYILSNLLTQMVGSIYRQPMFAKFEADLHTWIEHQEPVSSSRITDYWLQLNKDYYGDSVLVDDLQRYGCYYIPHFYYNFYVYKYTLGMSVALCFATRILHGDVDDYRAFLTKGGSESPIDELINAGVDPRSNTVYDEAFTFFKETLDEFKACME